MALASWTSLRQFIIQLNCIGSDLQLTRELDKGQGHLKMRVFYGGILGNLFRNLSLLLNRFYYLFYSA